MHLCKSMFSLLPAVLLVLAACTTSQPPAPQPLVPEAPVPEAPAAEAPAAEAPAAEPFIAEAYAAVAEAAEAEAAEALVAEVEADDGLLYTWVQLVSRSALGDTGADSHAPVLVARAIVDDLEGPCPEITAVNNDTADSALMVPRENNVDPDGFPILVCEARVPWSADEVSIGGRALGFSPSHLVLAGHPVLVGDTGCKGDGADDKDCPPKGSDPGKAKGWGFPKVVDAIVDGDEPSVLVHVGDYIYRRMPDVSGCTKRDPCDIWETWDLDFFDPAADLLDGAPWLMARGNHETCTPGEPRVEGGNGWFLLMSAVTPCMDPGDDLPGCSLDVALRTCESADAEFPPPWAVDLPLPEESTAAAVRAVVMDTSAGKETATSAAEIYRSQYESLPALIGDAPRAWMVTHVPIYAVSKVSGNTDQKLESVNENLQTATRGLSLPAALEIAMVGHRHIVQAVNTDNGSDAAVVPPHMVMGASGVALSGKSLPHGTYYGTTEAGIDGDGAATLSGWIQRYHSYADFEPGTGQAVAWRVTIVDSAGDKRADCDLSTGTPGWGTRLTCKSED